MKKRDIFDTATVLAAAIHHLPERLCGRPEMGPVITGRWAGHRLRLVMIPIAEQNIFNDPDFKPAAVPTTDVSLEFVDIAYKRACQL